MSIQELVADISVNLTALTENNNNQGVSDFYNKVFDVVFTSANSVEIEVEDVNELDELNDHKTKDST